MDIRGTDWCGCTLNHFQHSASSQLGRLLRFVSSCTNHIFNQLHIAWTEYTALRVVDALCTSCAKAALAQSYISCAWFCFLRTLFLLLKSVQVLSVHRIPSVSLMYSHLLWNRHLTHCLSYLSTFIILFAAFQAVLFHGMESVLCTQKQKENSVAIENLCWRKT